MSSIFSNAEKARGTDSEAEETDVLQLTADFHSLYRTFHLRKNERRQTQRRDKSQRSRSKQRCKILADTITTSLPVSTPRIDVLGNCSLFAAYAVTRQVVLGYNFADACRKWLVPLEDTEGENDNAGERLPSPVPLPKTLICGLEVVFQLIEGSHILHPSLCVKSLESLLTILESQSPQSFRKEPASVIDTLFSILLSLSKSEEINIPSSSKTKSVSNPLTSIATACLISLAIARGDTKSVLEAIASLFMCCDECASQEVKNPEVLKSLQRSTQAILVGRSVLPQWLSHGIPTNSLVYSYRILWFPLTPSSIRSSKSLACDGRYLYLHCNRGIFKIGSGTYGSIEAHHCHANEDIFLNENVWLGWASGNLYCRVLSSNESKLHLIDQENLQITKSIEIPEEKVFTMFSDGINIGMILSTKEDGFLVRTMSPTSGSMETLNEFNLRLVRKSVEVAGPCPWDAETNLRPILTGVDDDVASITSGKDFALLRTQHGRIMYCGKGASLGQKSGLAKYSKWLELGLSKCPRFVQCAVGHEGIHALLLAEDGTAYFVGTPKRGEDGDQAKLRRVAKASKPKKVIRMEGHDIVSIACNNGTSTFVSRSGDAYMYGKDTAHCDATSGHLVALRGVFITQIAMGKAHSVILSGDGKVYTMGINNRGQCGRSLLQPKDDAHDTIDDEDGEWEEGGATGGIGPSVEPDQEGMCPAGTHRWKHEQCMVCTMCRECTGYGSACISALRPDRNPGQECGCGVGDAGCAECGSCRTCAREGIEEQDYLALNPEELPEFIHMEDPRLLVPEPMQPERKPSKPCSSINVSKTMKQKSKETSMTSFPPNPLKMPTNFPITQVACGLHHTIFLDSKGSMFACGSNTFGQLGQNDLSPRHTPTKIKFPESNCRIIQIAAGSYHTVALDSDGIVYTCGAHTKGQLARVGDDNDSEVLWFAKMTALENIGVKVGRRVTWIGATGDCTYIRLEASLISPNMLQKSTVTANSSTIIIVPPPWTQKFATSIMINRRDGCCSYFEGDNQVSVNTEAVCLDPMYDLLWTVQSNTVKCYNVIASGFRQSSQEVNLWLSKPPFTIPVAPNAKLQRWQAGANMLACLATLVSAHIQGFSVQPEEQAAIPALAKAYSRDDYSAVCRFESHGGGWGYSGHSIEAVRFSCDADIILGGFGLFGGRGENTAKIKVFDIGTEGGEIEGDGELLAESEEIPFECASRQKYRMMFQDPVQLQAGRWYVAWAHISGASSDCGSNGQSSVLAEDQVMFHFKSSKKSNNGTDMNAGQIPQVLYRLNAVDQANMGSKPKQQMEPVHLLSNDFVSNFSPDSIQVLITLIGWCWGQLQDIDCDYGIETKPKTDLMKFVACSCLRLIEFSINQVYKHKGCVRLGQSENLTMAEAIGDVRSMLHKMISTPLKKNSNTAKNSCLEILNQCCDTFVNCFQVFYPTSALKWECLANFMHLYLEKGQKYARMLSCVVGALCACRGQLLGIFPVLNTIVRQSPDETSLTFVTNTEGGKLKQPANNRLLVGQMSARNGMDDFIKPTWSFWEVLEHILSIVDMDETNSLNPMKKLIHNSSLLLAKLMEELVSHAAGIYAELECSIGQIIVSTPSRFTRTNQSRTWNTGNGSPDAVCFTVDQPGVSIFGACIYSGTGTYEYELELFQEVEDLGVESCDQGAPKWNSLEMIRGTFDSDECWGDIAEIKFNKPVLLKPGIKYAIRLKNHGGRTCNGDGGVSILRCPDGTTFNFSSCAAHSLNGTNQIRGQIPQILYFRNPDDSDATQMAKAIAETQARKCAHRISTAIFDNAKEVIENVKSKNIEDISNCTLITTLLPSILSHLPHLAMSDPRSSVELLEMIRRILPSVSDLNNRLVSSSKGEKRADAGPGVHYSWVESDHPYRMATIVHYKVTFPSTVQRMTVEFDPRCHTAQSEDSVQMYIPYGKENSKKSEVNEEVEALSSYIPIMERFHGDAWPQKTIILPGNEVLFSLETASDFVRMDRREYFGFRCLVSGFEWKSCAGLSRLEMELAFLGGFCAHQLIKKDLVLPPVSAEEVETIMDTNGFEEKMIDTCIKHNSLFAKGIGLEYFPTVQEALDGIVPLREKSKEREFVADFISRTPNSSGERLANWLQPESFVDPSKCEVVTSKDPIKRGKPTVVVIVTRDQYGEPVVAPNLLVELKAVPQMTSEPGPRSSQTCTGLYKCLPGQGSDNLEVSFQVTVKDKMKYHAVTMMKEYENYSFEELRLMSPTIRRFSESMLIRQNNNATYTATWTPACTGLYYISLTVDGYTIPQVTSVDVEEAPDGSFSSQLKKPDENAETSDSHSGKMRKFKASDSAGLRIRSHPSLQSEQIGRLPINGVIRFTIEVHNDDGIWVKLNDPSVQAFCDSLAQTKNIRTEGWCLQYNQHVGKTLLFPVEGPKQLPDLGHGKGLHSIRKMTDASFTNADTSSKALRLNGSPGLYQVVNCGVSGHNIRARPSLRSPSVGILAMGMKFYSVDECINSDGLWVKLDHVSQQKYCYTSEGEAWSLAVGKGETVHLRMHDGHKSKKGFDFSIASQNPQSLFDNVSPPAAFGSVDNTAGFNADLKLCDDPDQNITMDGGSYLFPASLDDMTDESLRQISPVHSPDIPAASVEHHSSGISLRWEKSSESHYEKVEATSREDRSIKSTSSRSSKSSSFSALQKWLQLGSSSETKSSIFETENVSGSKANSSSAPSSIEMTKSLVKERISALTVGTSKSVSSATQTSPDEVTLSSIPVPVQFNIGSAGPAQSLGLGLGSSPVSNSKPSPKTERKHKNSSSRPRCGRRDREKDRPKSPQRLSEIPILTSAPVKCAVGPGPAQSFRAVFGAILWNAGIIHDAMACASYLRFHKHSDIFTARKSSQPTIPLDEDELLTSILNHSKINSGEKISHSQGQSQEREKLISTTNKNEETKSVILRKKSGLPSKSKQEKQQRHSVEVTCAAWYLKENPELKIEEFDIKALSLDKERGPATQPEQSMDDVEAKEQPGITAVEAEDDEYPPAMAALEKIWNYVKNTCSEALFKDIPLSAVVDISKGTPVKMRKEKKASRSVPQESKLKCKKERPRQLQTIGRSFLLVESEGNREFSEEMQQCEICQVRFPRKGRSRNVHFGLSIMCENCSERHLKIKKQLFSAGKAHSTSGSSSAPSENIPLKYVSPSEMHQPHSTIMNNSFFLLQMINTVSDNHPQADSSIIPLKSPFSCYAALGVTESQMMDDDSPFNEANTPDGKTSETSVSREGRSSLSNILNGTDDELTLRIRADCRPRRRKVSNGDQIPGVDDSGFTLLNHPSAALTKILEASQNNSESDAISKMCGGIVHFVVEKHDLDHLKLYLFQAIRRVTCRSYGMQMLAWMMKNVSQPTALHDLLWWYASSLEIKSEDEVIENENLDNGWWQMRIHPLAESPSTIFPVLTESFHILLQTISDVMPFLPIGSPLLEMAVKCWGVCFSRKDHKFLHRSKIFRNLSQIMSQFDGENEWSKSSLNAENLNPFYDPQTEITTCLGDLTSTVDVKVSSRGALCPSLTDSSTETFWESGEEDRSRTKSITIISNGEMVVKVLAVHVDNIRDSQYKVSSIAVKVGPHLEELVSVGHVEIDIRHCGWCWFPIENKNAKVFKMELKGPDNTLRARQIRVLGFQSSQLDVLEKSGPNTLVAQRKCENETLRIFRLLSSEVFGKLLNYVKRGEDDAEANDLQEHVVGILFSRNKLTHLQKQVCSHIVGAIHREAIKIKEEFDSHVSSSILEATQDNNIRMILGDKPKIGDRYCFEMLSLVLALAGSKLGRSYLSQQSNLIQDLMNLLHVGTPRIQRQVTSVLRKILPEINPDDFSKIVCTQDVSGESKLGILDMLLGCVIKSLQVKVRTSQDGNRSARNISTNEVYNTEELPTLYWFLRGEGDIQLANTVVKLIKDMSEDSFSEEWAAKTKPAIAEAVLYLTKIDASSRSSEECLIVPKFWVALAALCVLHPDHSKLLSSPVFQNGGTGRAKCVNHDDGETLAVIQCSECQDLCAECDRFLHLPKKSWKHLRKVCKEEEESIKVDLHEGCGRIKLFWLMALADSSTLKALVEFRSEIPKAFSDSITAVTTVGRCRFCNKVGNSGPLALGNVCGEVECQEYSKTSCERILECGHLCGGVRNEMRCLPCLQGCSDKLGTILKQDSDDMCMICFTDALAFAPAIQLMCGHVFHYHCCRSVLERKWAGPRITFSFSYCPICKADICHALLEDVLNPIRELFLDVQRKGLMRLEYEGLNNIEAITMPGGRYYNNPAGFAMDRYAYYVCFKCKKAYFGGEARCDLEIPMEFDPSELVCGGCSDVSQAQLCPRHGTDFLEYKCRYCCSVAVFFCFGTTHFCNGCHDDFQRITAIPKNQLPSCPAGPRANQLEGEECPLHVFHPPTGEEFALGCGICRNAHTF